MAIILNKDNSKGKEEINEEDIKKLAGNLDVIFAKTSAKKLGEINKLFIQIGEKLLSNSIKKHPRTIVLRCNKSYMIVQRLSYPKSTLLNTSLVWNPTIRLTTARIINWQNSIVLVLPKNRTSSLEEDWLNTNTMTWLQ